MDAGVGHTAWARRTKSSRPEGPKAGPKGRQLEVLLKRLSAKWRQNRPHWSDQFGLSHCNWSLWQSAIAFEKQWELVENRKSIPFCTNIHNNGGNFEKQCEFAENRLKNIPLALKFSTDFAESHFCLDCQHFICKEILTLFTLGMNKSRRIKFSLGSRVWRTGTGNFNFFCDIGKNWYRKKVSEPV